MQTYLTTYSAVENNSDKEQGNYRNSNYGRYEFSDSGGASSSALGINVAGYTFASGLSVSEYSITAENFSDQIAREANSEGETIELISTDRSPPYSIYTGSRNYYFLRETQYVTETDTNVTNPSAVPMFRGTSVTRTIRISHYGTATSSAGGGKSNYINGTFFQDDENWSNAEIFEIHAVGGYLPELPWNDQFTTFTAPVFATKVASLTIDTTTAINSSFNFLETQFAYNFTSSTTSVKTYEYSSTTTSTTDYIHNIGTSFGSNNSYFTQILQSDSDGNEISPYSAVFIPPSGSFPTFTAGLISESSENIFQSTTPKFLPRESFTSSSLPANTILTLSYTNITETLFSYSATQTITTESTKNYTYTFNGDNGSWYTSTDVGTTMTTIETISVSEYTQTSNQGASFSSVLNGIPTFSKTFEYETSYFTSSNRGGVLDGYGTLYDSGIDIKTQEMACLAKSLSSFSGTFQRNYTISSSITSLDTDILNNETVSVTQNLLSGSSGQIQTSYFTNENFLSSISAQPTFYKAGAFNQGLAGMGNLYASNQQNRFITFTESPAVFLYFNRITYNASKFIPNYGIFSSIKQSQEELFKFPAIGIGKSFVALVPIYSDTTTSSLYTFTLRGLHTQPINSKVNAEFSIYYNSTNSSAVQKWALRKDVTNHKYFRYPTGSAGSITTYGISQSFTDYPMNYVSEELPYPEFINTKVILIEKNSARIKEYLTFDDEVIVVANNFATRLTQSYFVTDSNGTYISNFGNAMVSTSKPITIKPVITASRGGDINGCLFSGRIVNQGFEMLNSTHFLNFTNYNGSTYIDV